MIHHSIAWNIFLLLEIPSFTFVRFHEVNLHLGPQGYLPPGGQKDFLLGRAVVCGYDSWDHCLKHFLAWARNGSKIFMLEKYPYWEISSSTFVRSETTRITMVEARRSPLDLTPGGWLPWVLSSPSIYHDSCESFSSHLDVSVLFCHVFFTESVCSPKHNESPCNECLVVTSSSCFIAGYQWERPSMVWRVPLTIKTCKITAI